MALPLQCPKCQALVLESTLNQLALTPCSRCKSGLLVEVFPAFFRSTPESSNSEIILVEGESTCFYHAGKKAVLPCHACGRFICALCDCELNGEHFCPGCLETGKTKGTIRSIDNQRTLYDSIALTLTVLPIVTLIFWFMSVITAPMAVVVALRYWNAPRSIVRRTKFRYVLALIFACIQIIFWAMGFYTLMVLRNG